MGSLLILRRGIWKIRSQNNYKTHDLWNSYSINSNVSCRLLKQRTLTSINNMTFPVKFSRVLQPCINTSLFFTESNLSSISKEGPSLKTSTSNYTSPQKFVESCPPSLQPYLRLSRIHRPIGTWLLFWPCTWGLVLGSGGLPELSLLTLFGVGAFIMRGAGCTINDMWDRHIDRRVQRTSDRPLAAGELRMRHATVWLALQLSLAFSILLQLNAPCFIIGVGSLGLVTVYPLAKRITNWPQIVLGMTFNTGILMGLTAAQTNQLGYLDFPWIDPIYMTMYLAGISWTLIYDTIYAYQDIEDDSTLGLGSTARRFGENSKTWLTGFSALMISSLTASGILADLSWPYYVGIATVASHLVWQIKTLDINDGKNCSDRFDSNRNIGWLICMSILTSLALSNRNNKKNSTSEKFNDDKILYDSTSPLSCLFKVENDLTLYNYYTIPKIGVRHENALVLIK